MLELPLFKLVGDVIHDETKLDIDRFVPFLMRVSLTGEVSQVELAAAVRTAAENLCDEVFLVLVEGKHRLILAMLSPSRVDSPSGTVLESDTDDVVEA